MYDLKKRLKFTELSDEVYLVLNKNLKNILHDIYNVLWIFGINKMTKQQI